MDIIIQSLGFKASEHLEDLIREKLNRIINESDKVIRANVTLYIGSDSNPENNVCEIRLEVPGNDLFIKESAKDDFEQAVDSAVNKLQSMLRKTKEKQVDQWHGRANS